MYKNSSIIVVVLAFGVAVGTLQTTVMVPMLPLLQTRLGISPAAASWTLTAALLSGAVSIPLMSRLGDMYGRRQVMLVSLGLLVAGSVVSAASAWLPLILAGRVLQGAGAPLLPLAIGIARQAMPGPRLPAAIGVLSATIGVGSGGGMVLAGLVAGDYQAMFWMLAALGTAAFALTAAVVREPAATRPDGGRPDLLGAGLVSVMLVCLLLAVSKGPSWGWVSLPTLGLLAPAVAVAVIWVVTARRTATPLIEISMLTHRGTVGATVGSLLLGFALFAVITTLSAVAQAGLGATVLQVGFYLLPTTVMMLVVSLASGRLMRRFSAATLVIAGSAVVAIAALWLVLSHARPLDLYGAATVLGVGVGLGYAALGTMAVQHVEGAKTASAGGVNALVRLVGGSLAGAVTAATLSGAGAAASFGTSAVAAVLAAVCVAAFDTPARRQRRSAALAPAGTSSAVSP